MEFGQRVRRNLKNCGCLWLNTIVDTIETQKMASYESMPLEGRAAIVKDLSLSLIAFTCGLWAKPPVDNGGASSTPDWNKPHPQSGPLPQRPWEMTSHGYVDENDDYVGAPPPPPPPPRSAPETCASSSSAMFFLRRRVQQT